MQEPSDELTLYDRTRKRLRQVLAGQLPGEADLESTLTAYAYWVCTTANTRNADWEATLRDYADIALRRAADESEAERREVALLRRELARAHGPVLDVGAGWGRLAPLYDELGLQAVYVEPAMLGTQLMRRDGLSRIVRSVGEALPFADGTFPTTVIGWVLHHDSSDLDAAGIVHQIARATALGGILLSVEPLGVGFDQEKWAGLLTGAGFEVNSVKRFFETETSRGETEHHALAVGTRCTTMWKRASLTYLIDEHLARHPAMEPRDVYKLLYQGVLGPEHLIASPEDFVARLRTEYETVPPCAAEPLWEPVRPDRALMRLNLRPFKARGGDVEWLIAACLRTAEEAWGTPEELQAAWATFVELCRVEKWEIFPLPEMLAFSAWLEEHGYPPVHHSAGYKEANEPAYRLLCKEFLSHLKIEEVKDV